jgi:hypothetical protein
MIAISWNRYLIVWYAIILHWIQGILLVLDDSAGWVTSTSHVREWMHLTPDALGLIYITVGSFAALSLLLLARFSIWRMVVLVPQQFFLVLAALGAVDAMWNSQFADGVVRSQFFIVADQIPIVIATALHSLALVDSRVAMIVAMARRK